MSQDYKNKKVEKWSKVDDAKLQQLFWKPPSKEGVKTQDLSQANIKGVQVKHWPEQSYNNFSDLFCKKAQEWNIAASLNGACKYHWVIVYLYILLVVV